MEYDDLLHRLHSRLVHYEHRRTIDALAMAKAIEALRLLSQEDLPKTIPIVEVIQDLADALYGEAPTCKL